MGYGDGGTGGVDCVVRRNGLGRMGVGKGVEWAIGVNGNLLMDGWMGRIYTCLE